MLIFTDVSNCVFKVCTELERGEIFFVLNDGKVTGARVAGMERNVFGDKVVVEVVS